MRKLMRLGVIILTLALSLTLINLMRNGNTTTVPGGDSVQAHRQSIYKIFLPPRDLNLQIDASSDLTITIYDPSNITVFRVQNIRTGSYTLCLQKRGSYNFSIYNSADWTVDVDINLTLYNLDKDMTQASIGLAVIGIALILVQQVRAKMKHATEKMVSKEAATN